MKIVIVEDEETLREYLKVQLEGEGFSVKTLSSLDALKNFLEQNNFPPQVFLLDRMLEGQDSLTVIPKIRSEFESARILVLSAIDTAIEKALALNAGADDYLAKPFSSVELLARINALARRKVVIEDSSEIEVSNFVVNKSFRRIQVKNGGTMEFTHREFQILMLFCLNPKKVFSKEFFLEKVWNSSDEVETKVVEVTVTKVRKKLEEAGAKAVIKNMRNVGYWIEA